MKKTFYLLLQALFIFGSFSCQSPSAGDSNSNVIVENATLNQAQQGNTRYGIKSGIIYKKIINSMMKGENTTTVWFDQYGAVEVSENHSKLEMMGQKIEENTWSSLREGVLFSYKIGQSTGTKINITKNFDSKNIDWSKMSDELMKQYKIEKAGNEEFLGKTCEVYNMNNPEMGAVGKYLLWKNIVMKSETRMMGITVVEEVTKLDENVSIPASKFELPKEVEFREIQMPGK